VREVRDATMVTGGPLARLPNSYAPSHARADAGRVREHEGGHSHDMDVHHEPGKEFAILPRRKSLPIARTVIESSERPTAVAGWTLSGRFRFTDAYA